MNQSVVVATFSFPLDAHIAKANLESVGISSFIADEHTVNMQWLYSDAMGGVRLFVQEKDLEEARKKKHHDRKKRQLQFFFKQVLRFFCQLRHRYF